jgi:hypothetical protein
MAFGGRLRVIKQLQIRLILGSGLIIGLPSISMLGSLRLLLFVIVIVIVQATKMAFISAVIPRRDFFIGLEVKSSKFAILDHWLMAI